MQPVAGRATAHTGALFADFTNLPFSFFDGEELLFLFLGYIQLREDNDTETLQERERGKKTSPKSKARKYQVEEN